MFVESVKFLLAAAMQLLQCVAVASCLSVFVLIAISDSNFKGRIKSCNNNIINMIIIRDINKNLEDINLSSYLPSLRCRKAAVLYWAQIRCCAFL